MKENYLCKNDWVQGCSQFYFLLRFLLPQRQRVARLGDERCLCKLGAHPKQKKKLSACVEGKELKGIPQSPQCHDRMEHRPGERGSVSGIPGGQPPGGARFNSPGGGQIHDVDAGDDHRFSFTLRRPASVV